MFSGTLRMLCLWCSELEIPRRHFSDKSLSGETGNISRGLAGHGFTKAAMIRWERAVKPKTRFSLGQGDEIQTFNMRRRVSREFVAGPCPRNFMKQRQLRHEPFAVTGKWEFRITTCSPSLICTIFNCTTGKRGFDHKVPPFQLLDVASTHRNWSFSTPPFPLPHGQCCAYCRSWKFVTGPSEKFHGAVWEIHNGSCGGTPLHDFSGTQHRVPVWNATKQSVARNFMFRTCALALVQFANIVQGNILASWSQNQNPFRMSEGDESDGNFGVLLIRTLDDTRYSSRIAISWCSCHATSRWWWIHSRSSISFFRKILAYIQICSNCLCPFTSRSRLFALTTDLPGPADGPLNIVQGNVLASWSQNPFRMSEGGESDGNLGVLHIRTLDETRYSSKIAIFWCSCLATSRWWWIHHSSSIHHD